MRTFKTDVLVVGCGPAGLTATIALAKQGVSTVSLSQWPGTAHTPRAHITNMRSMEVFRDLGVEEAVQEVGFPLPKMFNNVIATSLSGLELARYKSYGTPNHRLSDYAACSPCVALNAPQHTMEPVLLKAARDFGADVRYNNLLTEISQTADEVTALVRNHETGEEYRIVAQYAIGADGGRSTVAEQFGFTVSGQAGLKGMSNSWLEVDLTKYVEYRPGVIYSVLQPNQLGQLENTAWVNVHPWNEWSLLHPWEADRLPTEDEIIARARKTIGDPDIPVKVKEITTWQVNNVVADFYQDGRVFLAGDAAHRHPPSGGLGTNTSVQDSYNLAWKLAWVLSGKAGRALLDTYNPERQPVGAQVVQRAIKSHFAMNELVEALDFEQTEAEAGGEDFRGLYSPGPVGVERRRVLAAAVKQQDYRSNAVGVELGQRYTSSAVVPDGTEFPESGLDSDLYYQASTFPGAHLPHAWVEHDKNLVSTIDLVRDGEFALIVGIDGQGWAEAAGKVAADLGISLPVLRIGLRCEYDDVISEWEQVRGVTDSGAILVRPDRFIAWRSMDADDDPAATLDRVMHQVLAR